MILMQGRPALGFDFEKDYIEKGTVIDGFTAPYNLYGSTLDIFMRFGLWNNTNGLCVDGKNHEPIRSGVWTCLAKEPIMPGDFILGQQIISAANRYNNRLQAWEVHVIEFGKPIIKESKEYENKAMDSIAEQILELARRQVELTEKIFKDALPLCTVAQAPSGTSPITTAPALPIVNTLKEQVENAIKQAENKIEETKWQ